MKGKCTGIILAGGKSSRMEGADKAKMLYKDKSLTANAYAILAPLCNELIVSSNQQALGLAKGTKIVGDNYKNIGPLAGLQATLAEAKNEICLVITCDTPLLNTAFYQFLLANLADFDAVIATENSKFHPLASVLKKSILPILEKNILIQNYKILDILNQTNICKVDITKKFDAKMLSNINTPTDFKQLNT